MTDWSNSIGFENTNSRRGKKKRKIKKKKKKGSKKNENSLNTNRQGEEKDGIHVQAHRLLFANNGAYEHVYWDLLRLEPVQCATLCVKQTSLRFRLRLYCTVETKTTLMIKTQVSHIVSC